MDRTVKDATVRVLHYVAAALAAHIAAFVTAYNFAKHLKTLRWHTPFQAVCNTWRTDASVFRCNPHHLIPGLYT